MTDNKYKGLNRDMMKYLALIPMFIGHAVAWINLMKNPESNVFLLPIPLLIISGLSLFCPPVMFFFIVDGYKYTKDRKKYAIRLFIFALISQPFHWLIFQPIFGWWEGNVIFTLFCGLLSIIAFESRFKLWQRILLIVLCCGLNLLFYSDWVVFGVLFILFLHIFRERPKARFISYTILITVHTALNLFSLGTVPTFNLFLYMFIMLATFMLAYLCMTKFYNGRKSKHPIFAKWFFYIFYPLHYLIIFAIKMIMDIL